MMQIRPLPDTPRLRLDLMRAELELCARTVAKFDPRLKRTGESSWGTGKRVERPEPTRPLLLDLFCGAGGAAMGYSRAGFDVIGIDHKPQPRYPFRFLQADLTEGIPWDALKETFGITPGDVAAYHASPPCQRYAGITKTAGNQNNHPDLVGVTRDYLKQLSKPYVIENVPEAPLQDALMLCGTMFGLLVIRHRLFEVAPTLPYFHHPPCQHIRKTVTTGRRPDREKHYHTVVGHYPDHEFAKEAMGIDWMTRNELKEAIPPAYTEYIGRHLIAHLERQPAPSGGERVLGIESGQEFCEVRENTG